MRILIELLVIVNATGGIATLLARHLLHRRRASNLDHVHQLEEENAQMDEALKRLTKHD